MDFYTTLTPKFQLHVPVKVRKLTGITKHGRLKIKTGKGRFTVIQEKHDILSLAGKLKVKNPIPAEKIRDYIDYSDL